MPQTMGSSMLFFYVWSDLPARKCGKRLGNKEQTHTHADMIRNYVQNQRRGGSTRDTAFSLQPVINPLSLSSGLVLFSKSPTNPSSPCIPGVFKPNVKALHSAPTMPMFAADASRYGKLCRRASEAIPVKGGREFGA